MKLLCKFFERIREKISKRNHKLNRSEEKRLHEVLNRINDENRPKHGSEHR